MTNKTIALSECIPGEIAGDEMACIYGYNRMQKRRNPAEAGFRLFYLVHRTHASFNLSQNVLITAGTANNQCQCDRL